MINNLIAKIKNSNKYYFTKEEIIEIIKDNGRPILESEGIIVDPDTYTITVNEQKHTAPKKLFDLVYYLISNKNKMMNKSKILANVWGTDVIVDPRTIDVHIRKIRIIIKKDLIKTIKCRGYGWLEN